MAGLKDRTQFRFKIHNVDVKGCTFIIFPDEPGDEVAVRICGFPDMEVAGGMTWVRWSPPWADGMVKVTAGRAPWSGSGGAALEAALMTPSNKQDGHMSVGMVLNPGL